jgi:hypothetical protein
MLSWFLTMILSASFLKLPYSLKLLLLAFMVILYIFLFQIFFMEVSSPQQRSSSPRVPSSSSSMDSNLGYDGIPNKAYPR